MVLRFSFGDPQFNSSSSESPKLGALSWGSHLWRRVIVAVTSGVTQIMFSSFDEVLSERYRRLAVRVQRAETDPPDAGYPAPLLREPQGSCPRFPHVSRVVVVPRIEAAAGRPCDCYGRVGLVRKWKEFHAFSRHLEQALHFVHRASMSQAP